MANQNSYIVKELDIIKSIQYYRLKREKELLEVSKAKADGNITEDTKWYNLVKKSKNAINKSKSEKKGNQLEVLNDEILKFENDNADYKFNLYFEGKLNEYIDKIYENDKYGIRKILLGVTIILDELYEYDYEDDEFEIISSLLFNNANKLKELKKSIKTYYSDIYGKSFNIDPKGMFGTLGNSGRMIFSTFPFMAQNEDEIAPSLDLLKVNDVKLGFQLTILLSLLGGSDLMAGSYSKLKTKNLVDAKNLVNTAQPQDLGLIFAIKALMFDESIKRMMENDVKIYITDTLEIFNSIRTEIENNLLVEKLDVKANKARLEMLHDLEEQFMDSLKI